MFHVEQSAVQKPSSPLWRAGHNAKAFGVEQHQRKMQCQLGKRSNVLTRNSRLNAAIEMFLKPHYHREIATPDSAYDTAMLHIALNDGFRLVGPKRAAHP